MTSVELLTYGFFGLIFLMTIGSWLHARSIDLPLENEEYLSENPELRKLKEDDTE